MPTSALNQIDVGGPCKVNAAGSVIYFEEGVKITPQPKYRGVPSSVGGEHDDNLVDLVYKITGRPKAVWNATYQGALLPAAYTNWSTSGARMCGVSNQSLIVLGSDANGFTFTRACLTRMPSVFLGLGESLYDEVEWTAFWGQGKALTDTDAFYSLNTTAWSQADYPTTHQEVMCTGAWGSVTGWDTVFAEKGFKLQHELKTTPVMSGNVTVDYRINSYRARLGFNPQQPTTTQLLSAWGLQGASNGIGTRRSANAFDFVTAGSGISVTAKSVAMDKGDFVFDHKANRHGEFGLVTAMTAPGTRLTLA